MFWGYLAQFRVLDRTSWHHVRATCMEAASGWRTGRAWQIAGQDLFVCDAVIMRVQMRYGLDQSPRVGMCRIEPKLIAGRDLD